MRILNGVSGLCAWVSDASLVERSNSRSLSNTSRKSELV
jgi:hypothetical protein